ncbi:MAG: glycosyltransferase family 39 protein [Acidimicrobiia bacterium]
MSASGQSPPLLAGGNPPAERSRADRRRNQRWYVVGTVTIVLIALSLRFYHLGSQSFWIDEINVMSFVRSGHLFSDLRDRGGPFEPPLHFLTVRAALLLPIGFETAARVPSAIFGTVEVLALMLVTREATNRRTPALVAGLLLALAPFAVRYSQESRYYVMFSALSLMAWWLLLRALRLRRRGDWLGYGVVAGAMLLTHPFAPLVLVAQAAFVGVVFWRERKTAEGPALVIGYLLAVVVGFGLIRDWFLYGMITWIPNALNGKSYTLNPTGKYAVPLDEDLFKRGAEWLLGNSTHVTVLIALLVILAVTAPVLARGRERVVATIVLAYVIGFVLVLVPLARYLGTYFAYRRVESLLPPLLLLVAVALVSAVDRLTATRLKAQVAFNLGVAVVVILAVLSLASTISYYGTEKSNYRAFARLVREAPAGQPIVVGPSTPTVARLVRQYFHWKGVDRRVTYAIHGQRPKISGPLPKRILWLTTASPNRADMKTLPLNDLDSMQVIAGDRSGLLIILPLFVSTSEPHSKEELDAQADAVAGLPAFLPAP